MKLVFVGDGNNVARSLAAASALLGVEQAPWGYEFPPIFEVRFAAEPSVPGGRTRSPKGGRSAPTLIAHTDVWAMAGQEHEAERDAVTVPYQVNQVLRGVKTCWSSSIAFPPIAAKR